MNLRLHKKTLLPRPSYTAPYEGDKIQKGCFTPLEVGCNAIVGGG